MSRKGFGLPEHVKFLKFSQLHNSQTWVMADWLGVRVQLSGIRSVDQQRAFMEETVQKNLERAQQAYEIVVLQKTPKAALPEDMEKRMYHVLGDIVNKHRDEIGELAENKLSAAAEEVKKTLSSFAKQAILEAAAKAAPLTLKEKGKKDRVIKGVLPPEFKRMVQLGHARKNIMLVGPTQCGKSYMAEKLAEALDLPFRGDQSCSAGISESVFIGWLLPGKGGNFEHVTTPFLIAYEQGGVFVLEEMDAADANLLVFLNKAIANDGFYLPQRKHKPLVKRHRDFVIVAACNTYGHGADIKFVGRNQLDASTLERFRVGVVPCDYSREVEESIVASAVKDQKEGRSLLQWAWAVRDGIREKTIQRFMSTRTIKDLADMMTEADWKRPDWETAYFADWSNEERNLLSNATAMMEMGSAS